MEIIDEDFRKQAETLPTRHNMARKGFIWSIPTQGLYGPLGNIFIKRLNEKVNIEEEKGILLYFFTKIHYVTPGREEGRDESTDLRKRKLKKN